MWMAGGRTGNKARGVAAGAGADRITALPSELHARIASLLPYRQAIRLSALSRPRRRVHHHTPVVELNLSDFLDMHDILIDGDALAAIEATLLRRAQDGSGGCKVETLRLTCGIYDPSIWRHAARIIALADAREIRIVHDSRGSWENEACALDLPPAARALEVIMFSAYVAPTIAGPGAAFLRELFLSSAGLREWPFLPSLRSLTLNDVFVCAPFPAAAAACCPLLEDLRVLDSHFMLENCLDIRLPRLKRLAMLGTDYCTYDALRQFSVFGDASVTVDAPELEEIELSGSSACQLDAVEYPSFALRSPRLRRLCWRNQLARRLDISAGRPCSVAAGTIEFTSSAEDRGPGMKPYRAFVVRMLGELLQDWSPELIADIARPHMALDEYMVKDTGSGKMIPEERLTCDLEALMASFHKSERV